MAVAFSSLKLPLEGSYTANGFPMFFDTFDAVPLAKQALLFDQVPEGLVKRYLEATRRT